MIDLLPPTAEETERAVAAYRELKEHGPVLVHCALGMTRSAAVTARILVAENRFETVPGALKYIRDLRPEVTLSAEALAVMREKP